MAIGINMANALAVRLGLMSAYQQERIKNILLKFNLPISYEIKNVDEFYDAFFLDKKAENSVIKFILPKGIGEHEIKKDIPKHIVTEILGGFR